MSRFVILRHEFPPGHARAAHWDVMFEQGDRLRTWAVLQSPDDPEEQPAEQLADHRREYLSYEGPIAGDRGHVTRWDEGTCETIRDERDCFETRVAGRRLQGVVRIAAARYRFISENSTSASSPM